MRRLQNLLTPQAKFKRQIRVGGIWQPDWSEQNRAKELQPVLAQFLETMQPDLIADLHTPIHHVPATFLLLAERWRTRTSTSYEFGNCPSRKNRSGIEFVLMLEVGPHPRNSFEGRVHGHALVWNPGAIPQERIAWSWREVARIDHKHAHEPHIEAYEPGRGGALYRVKEYGTAFDNFFISDGLQDVMAARAWADHGPEAQALMTPPEVAKIIGHLQPRPHQP